MLSTSQQAPMGNRSTLITIGKNGELRHLFWPSHNYPQHIRGSLPGLFLQGDKEDSFSWLTDSPWMRKQRYLADSTILETVFSHPSGILAKSTDLVLPDKDALLRVFEITNGSGEERHVSLLYYNDLDIAETPQGDACYYDDKMDAIVSYKRNYWFVFGSDRQSSSHQCGVHEEGSDAFVDASDGNLSGNSLALHAAMKGVNSCLKWDLGNLSQGRREQLMLFLCFANGKQRVSELIGTVRQLSLAEMVNNVNRYCQEWLRGNKAPAVPREWDHLMRRSLLTLRTLVSQDIGGIVAAPSLDPDYRYVWSRDGTYVAYALDRCGYHDDAAGFYRWCQEVQEPDGGWFQRYHVEKTPGPSWGEQEDQCATILWGIGQHYTLTKDDVFLTTSWPTIEKGVDHLLRNRDKETGLVGPSFDLWEEKSAVHTYTNAAAFAALRESSILARTLGYDDRSVSWNSESKSLQNAIARNLWDDKQGRFLKSLKPHDSSIDTALLGLTYPFCVFEDDDPRIVNTSRQIEGAFKFASEGLGRYQGDVYQGGNPWFITTLWMALYRCQQQNYSKAKPLIDWCASHVDELHLFAEQVHRENGEPISASPLAWSHAMFILSLLDYRQA